MQQELVLEASQDAGFSKSVDVGQVFRATPVCDGRRIAKNLPDQDLSKVP